MPAQLGVSKQVHQGSHGPGPSQQQAGQAGCPQSTEVGSASGSIALKGRLAPAPAGLPGKERPLPGVMSDDAAQKPRAVQGRGPSRNLAEVEARVSPFDREVIGPGQGQQGQEPKEPDQDLREAGFCGRVYEERSFRVCGLSPILYHKRGALSMFSPLSNS